MACFIFENLNGEAKDKVRYKLRTDREDPEKRLTVLTVVLPYRRSYFLEQLDWELLPEYSHAQFSLMGKVKQVSKSSLSQYPSRMCCCVTCL